MKNFATHLFIPEYSFLVLFFTQNWIIVVWSLKILFALGIQKLFEEIHLFIPSLGGFVGYAFLMIGWVGIFI